MPALAASAAYSYLIIITVAALLTIIILIERAFAALLEAYVPTNDSICSYYNTCAENSFQQRLSIVNEGKKHVCVWGRACWHVALP